ncbi:MAG TPA: S9 family peptidase [Candidatus Dormibacteraeota bacterium]|nr:S9 family peptidase [Candidatus Dormibacteraeota bacterium]
MMQRSRKTTALCSAILTLLSLPTARSQEKPTEPKQVQARLKSSQKPQSGPADDALKTLFRTRRFEQAAISPDGKKVAWVETVIAKNGAPTGDTTIFSVDTAGLAVHPRRIAAGAYDAVHSEGSVAWSPDSKQIAFLSDAEKRGQLQLYVTPAAGGPARKLTSVKGFLQSPAWSPDGKTIAILFTENLTKSAGPLAAEEHPTGEIKDSFYEQRLALIDLATGKLRQISPADTYIYEYDWSPDATKFVVSSALGNGDNNWWLAELSTLDPATGLMKSIYKPKLQIAQPQWSPDGARIAFIEGLMSDEGLTGGDIHSINASGGEPENLTPNRKSSPSWFTWTTQGKILLAEYAAGDSAIALLDPATRKSEQLWRGSERINAGGWGPTLALAADGKNSAIVRSSFASAPELWTGPLGDWKQLTHRNTGLQPNWGEAKSLTWKNDGNEVQGWLIYPKDFDPAKKYPLVVDVHGGPSYAALSDWPSTHDYAFPLAAAGYFVFQPNPRGSYGQGEAFTRGNVKDFGYGDFRDILAGVDEAIKSAPIDPNRLGLFGWSYGGYMTMWGVTQSNRFKAAVAGAGIMNWQSYYGENQIDQWMIPFFGKSVYDDPEVYAKSAPITFIKKVKTPTLVVVGDSDGECPTPQSFEFWHALKTQGVETQLVVYDHEGHMFAAPKHQRDVTQRLLAWFNSRLP